MFENIEAVIFDMDGTLIDSMWLWKTIDVEYLKQHQIDLPENLQDEIEGMSFSETAVYFKQRFQLADSVETIKQQWNQMATDYYMNQVTLKPDVIPFINSLAERRIKLGIGSSNSIELVTMVMKRFDLYHKFDSIRTSCQVDKGKPAPDIYLQVAQDLQVEPSKCMVFEDIPNGLIAGNQAGMITVAIYDDFSKHMEQRKRALANYYIDSYTQVLSYAAG